MEQNLIKVYSKDNQLLAVFSNEGDGLSPDAMKDLMVAPTVRLESGGIASFSFQMLASSEKFQQIKNVENIFVVDGRYYTMLNQDAIEYSSNENVSIANVMCLERQSLLSRQYHQIYNTSIYCYATKAQFRRFVGDCAEFVVYSYNCTNPGNTITLANAYEQIKCWTPYDQNNNRNSFAILTADEYKPTNWEDHPTALFMRSISISGNTATLLMEARTKVKTSQVFNYSSGRQYKLDASPFPTSIEKVIVNSTTFVTSGNKASYSTSDKEVTNYSYNSSTGYVTVNYYGSTNENINAVTIVYERSEYGKLSTNSTCAFGFGAEVVDIHTVCLLPKSQSKFKLTIDNVAYEDSQVRDIRNVIMPRGSAGYAVWSILRNTGWTLGVCDVIDKGFDPKIDFGVYNLESDMHDALYNLEYVQKLYGGIFVWNSKDKILDYRCENYEDYDAYRDGFNDWRGYVFREGKNMVEKPFVTVDAKIITRAYPLGFGNLNIRKVNNGKHYVENFEYTNDVYEGYIKQELIYDTNNDSGARMLLNWAKKELKKQCRPRTSIKLSVTDLRTVEGHEFEKFDINEVVRVYYWDEHAQENVIKDQRVIMWEYNPFAYWESEIELGDVTLNKTDLFKLIYKKVNNNPSADNTGKLPGSDIVINNSSDINSLPHYIELIARTTTENSDAISGLILDTDANHAQADLFAYYQKHMDNLLAESYAGLTVYADERKAEAILSAQHYTDQTVMDAEGRLQKKIVESEANLKLYADDKKAEAELTARFYTDTQIEGVKRTITETEAGLKAYADEKSSSVRAYAQGKFTTIEGDLQKQASNLAEFKGEVAEDYSSLSATVSGNYKTLDGRITKIETNSSSGFQAIQTEQNALAQQFSSFQTTTNANINGLDRRITSLSQAGFITYADAKEASAAVIAQKLKNDELVSVSTMETYVDNELANINLRTSVEGIMGDAGILIQSGPTGNIIKMNADRFDFSATTTVTTDGDWYFNGGAAHFSSFTLYLGGKMLEVAWDEFMMADGTKKRINYVKHYD